MKRGPAPRDPFPFFRKRQTLLEGRGGPTLLIFSRHGKKKGYHNKKGGGAHTRGSQAPKPIGRRGSRRRPIAEREKSPQRKKGRGILAELHVERGRIPERKNHVILLEAEGKKKGWERRGKRREESSVP